MRSEIIHHDETTDFSLTCPGEDSTDARVQEIQLRGNLPLLIGNEVLAEISYDDLVESWETAVSLPVLFDPQGPDAAGQFSMTEPFD